MKSESVKISNKNIEIIIILKQRLCECILSQNVLVSSLYNCFLFLFKSIPSIYFPEKLLPTVKGFVLTYE